MNSTGRGWVPSEVPSSLIVCLRPTRPSILGSRSSVVSTPRFVGLEDAAGGSGSGGVPTTVPDGLAREVVLDLEPVVARSYRDR